MYALYLVIFVASFLHFGRTSDAEDVIWGPGLEPHKLVLPARYLFLDVKGNYNISQEKPIEFKVIAKSLDKQRTCRLWANVLDRKDGSYILRYKMYEPCRNMEIHVKHDGKHLGKSPFIMPQGSIIYPENCVCPMGDVLKWLDSAGCGEIPEQIKTDLKPFKEIDWNKIRKKVIKTFDKPGAISLCHYVVKSNQVYRKCYGKYVGFKMFMDSILLSLTRKMDFPDVEFFSNLGDWPLVTKGNKEIPLVPIFSWCGSTDSHDILMPTYDITEAAIEMMGRVMLDMLSVQGNTLEPWEKRIPKIFWRGRDSNINRLKLIDISRKRPELFNVSLTNFFFYRDKQEEYGPKTEHVSFYRFFDYKYQVNIDGTIAAYRFPYLLAGGSLLFKQESKYYEHYYHKLHPNEHYIDLKPDLSDLLEKLNWALENDDKAKQIALNAAKFSNEHLLPKNIYCYHAHLFNEYSKLVKSEVNVQPGMELVEQPDEARACKCGDEQKMRRIEL